MSNEKLDQIYSALGGDTGIDRGVTYDLSGDNELGELLQTPNLWGHDPADKSYVPTAANLRDAITRTIGEARETVDIATLWELPTGLFVDAIRNGLNQAARTNPNLVVRILLGVPTDVLPKFVHHKVREWLRALNPPPGFAVYVGTTRTSLTSWNHAKIIVADGAHAITGGHNMVSEEYCELAPVHDVSMSLRGSAAHAAQHFLNYLWRDIADTLHFPVPVPAPLPPDEVDDRGSVMMLNGRLYSNRALPLIRQAAVPAQGGKTRVLSVGKLGEGLVELTPQNNASRTARLKAAALAQRSICLSQQMLDHEIVSTGVFWDEGYLETLAQAVARGVDLKIVITEEGSEGGYSGVGVEKTAQKLADVVAKVTGATGDRLSEICEKQVHVAPLHIYPDVFKPDSDDWKWVDADGNRQVPRNHAKVYIIDDEIFYVGSDNAYSIYKDRFQREFGGLQEFGFIVECKDALWQPLKDYWSSLWKYSGLYQYNWSK